MRQIALLGSTGSIGHSTLEVVRRHRDRFTVRSLAAGDNVSQLSRQIEEFAPRIVSVRTRSAADALQAKFPGITVLSGAEGIAAVASAEGTDTVVAAITGTAALEATVIAIRRGIRLCLANKETLVAAGDLIQKELARSQSELLPIDSEQSAIFQSLAGNHRTEVRRLILTASGGPFWRRPVEEFSAITVAEALAHPTWSMGRKITIDSATLINKALEIIEAHYLFQMPAERIEAVIHPQSVVHSMVEYTDGSVIAQLSPPDMKIPILYSLSYPERLPMTGHPLDLARLGRLEFYPIDPKRFPAVSLAGEVLRRGRSAGAVFNAAAEVAVEHFIAGRISFPAITTVAARMLEEIPLRTLETVEDVNDAITETKALTNEAIRREEFS